MPYGSTISSGHTRPYASWLRQRKLAVYDEAAGRAVVAPDVRVCVLAGREYAEPLIECGGIPPERIEQPLRGLGIGERLRWFKTRLKDE